MLENKALPIGLTCHPSRSALLIYVEACVRACVCACVRACIYARAWACSSGGWTPAIPTRGREFEDDLTTLVLVMRNLLFIPAAQLLRTKPCTREPLALSAAAVHATANHGKDHGEKSSVYVCW
jgi:hypothetical protein